MARVSPVQLRRAIHVALGDPSVTREILAAALGVLEAVGDGATFNPGDDLIDVYDAGRALGAPLPGGVDHDD